MLGSEPIRYGEALVGEWSQPVNFQVADMPSRTYLPFVSNRGSP